MNKIASTLSLIVVLLLSIAPTKSFSLSTLLSPLTDKNNFITLTPAKIPEDLEAIRECRKTAEWYATKDRSLLLNSEKSFLNAEAAINKNVVCFLARESVFPWRVLGSADIKMKKGEAYICNVFVRPELRSQGLGRRIMNGAEAFVEEQRSDLSTLSLDVYSQNKAAINLYGQLGYSAPGMHAVTSLLGQSAGLNLQVRMTKDLDVAPSTTTFAGKKLAFVQS